MFSSVGFPPNQAEKSLVWQNLHVVDSHISDRRAVGAALEEAVYTDMTRSSEKAAARNKEGLFP